MNAYSLNLVVLIGRVGKDAVLRQVKGKSQRFATFTLATYEKFLKKKDKTTWHNVTVWGTDRTVEWCKKNIKAGDLLAIRGRLDTRIYTKDGESRWATYIRADEITILVKGKKQEEAGVVEGETIEEYEEEEVSTSQKEDDDMF